MTRPRQHTVDEFLPTMNGLSLNHRMWEPPAPDEEMRPHIRRCRTEIARCLTAIDGKTNYGPVAGFMRAVYSGTVFEGADLLWLLGHIAYSRVTHVDDIDGRLCALPVGGPVAHQRLLRSNRGTIESYADLVTIATVREIR